MSGPATTGAWRRPSTPLLIAIAIALAAPFRAATAAEGDPANGGSPAAGAIALATLLPDLADLVQLAEFPQPAYRVGEFTSRRMPPPRGWSKSVAGNYARVDQREGMPEYVLMEAAGPGVITLISIARTFERDYRGQLRIYIDDAALPVIAGPMAKLFGGGFPGLPYPLAADACNCWNLYLPLPYAKRCRITSDDHMLIYHVVARSYPPGTPVSSFTAAQLARLEPAVHALAATLIAPDQQRAAPAGTRSRPFAVTVVPGASAVLASCSGPSSIRRLRLQGSPIADRDASALRRCLLTMSCDGEATISAPLLDFFGSAPGITPYQSLPMGVAKDGWLESRWVMPFASAATLAVANQGATPLSLRGEITTADYAWSAATMHFHATWHHANDVPTVPPTMWNYLAATGRGVFVGSAFSINNPLQAWWGEGAERIAVDGEAVPSLFGTGSDDYYGFGYCSPALFAHPYHGQTRCDGPLNYGCTSLYRYTILDRIPFTSSFRFDMELMHWKDCLVDMDVIDYWYALPGASVAAAPARSDTADLRPTRPFQPYHAAGAIEAEGMRIIEAPGSTAVQEGWGEVGAGRYLRWSPRAAGDTLVLTFAVAAAGDYRLIAQFIRGTGYGPIQLACNGVRAAAAIELAKDAFYPDPSGEVDCGVFHLAAGANRLEITSLPGPAGGAPGLVGIDYVIPLPLK